MSEEIPILLESLPRLIKALSADFGDKFSETNHDLNQTHKRILIIIKKENKINMTHLSLLSGMEKGSLTPIGDYLEHLNLIERIRSKKDRRNVYLKITSAGNTVVESILKEYEQYLEEKLAPLNKKDRKKFLKSLQIFKEISEKIDL